MVVSEADLLDIVAKESLTDKSRLVRSGLLQDLGIQSIDLISILFVIEEKYGTRIEEAEFPSVQTLGELLDFILQRINEPNAEARTV